MSTMSPLFFARTRLGAFDLRAMCGLLVLLAPPAAAQGPLPPVPKPPLTLKMHHDVDARPEDIAVTPNQMAAFVRCDDSAGAPQDVLLAFDLTTGQQVTITNSCPTCPPIWGEGTHLAISDAVQVTDSRAVIIGSKSSSSFVEILGISYSPVAVTRLNSFVFAGAAASDVAITPDGSKAVVVVTGRVVVFDLATSAILYDITLPGTGPTWSFIDGIGQQWADHTADTLEVTNQRAVVFLNGATNCGFPNFSMPLGEVRVVNLGTGATTAFSLPAVCFGEWAHDLTITPDGTRALAGSFRGLGLVGIDTRPAVLLDSSPPGTGPHAGGLFSVLSLQTGTVPVGTVVDSVLMSDTRALVASDRGWIRVYDITGDNLQNVVRQVNLGPPPQGDEGIHDMAISEDGLRAVVKGTTKNWVFTNLEQANAPFETWGNAQPFAGSASPRGSASGAAQDVWVSDSVVLTGTRAVAIATDPSTTTGYVQFIEIDSDSASCGGECSEVVSTKPVAFDSANDRLADITLSPNKAYVFVRASDSSNDLLGYQISSGHSITPPAGIDLLGRCRGVDHVEATNSRVITISVNPADAGGSGFVDIFSY